MSPEWERNRRVLPSILEAIGLSPMIELIHIGSDIGISARILLKLDFYNPTGSLKDRIYYRMFSEAERRGELKSGMIVLECSTGNAGISCAFVAAVKGYRCVIVMPEGMSLERRKLDEAYGAELVFTPGGESDVDLALRKTEEIRSSDPEKYWAPAQFDNPDNIEAHYHTTGPEIWEQAGGEVDAFIATQGTGGTITGVGRYLRERRPDVQLWAVEPAECPLLSKRRWGSHGIEGIGDGFVPRNLDLSLLNGIVTATTEESVEMAKLLARREGIFCGISSGANVAAAIKLAKKHPDLGCIVTMINDTGTRYFSTALCGEDKQLDVPERDHPMDARTKAELGKYQPEWEIIE